MKISEKQLAASKYAAVMGFGKPYIIQENLSKKYEQALAKQLALQMDDTFLLGHCHRLLSQEARAILDIKQEVNAIFEEKKRVKRVLAALRRG